METTQPLLHFLHKIQSDPRITTSHIAAYMALYHLWLCQNCPTRLRIKGNEIMHLAKISSSATWHRVIRALDEYGYIEYIPTFNKMKRSEVSLDITSNIQVPAVDHNK